ncbi:MAG: class I SAM-dependent rRNA methyltransferase [Planctomycetia bacterium]|nr:class I SAM-dependent rRNA methyltransferase [Planctomycetia bacterium]
MPLAPATTAQVILKPRKAAPFWGRHPWVLDTAIGRVVGGAGEATVADGEVVDLVSNTGQWIARGIYNSHSRIRVRLYTWQPEVQLDDALWRERLTAAVALRRAIGYDDPAGAARLVFSEADQLSGLVVDRYAEHLVVQPTSLSMASRLDSLLPLLVEVSGAQSVFVRTDTALTRTEGIEVAAGMRHGELPSEAVTIVEHGLKYSIPWGVGQKTGFYLDQRENRREAARYMSGRRVLDVCCYTGGFSLNAALLGGAADVLGIDTSERAVELARVNAALNGATNVRFETGDCFTRLQEMVAADEKFGAVVLDPPRFARGRTGLDEALRAYHRLNRLAVDLLEPGGILITCSCSGSVSREDFFSMLFGVAQKTRREIQILEQRGATPDHPVNVACPENEYLKCFFCRVG